MRRLTRPRVSLLIVMLVAVAGVASTHRIFSHTLDEPAHVASGYDWLKGAPYTVDATHPPLARALFAIPAMIERVPRSDAPSFVDRGNSIFYAGGRYEHNVASARIPNLLFLAIGMLAAAAWTARACGARFAWLGAALFASPAILGHSGVATTDLAVAAMLPAALLAANRTIDSPTMRRALVAGIAVGIGLLTKFSFLPFFCAGVAALLLLRARRVGQQWRQLVVTALVVVSTSAALVFAGYRFEIATVAEACHGCDALVVAAAPPGLQPQVSWLATNVRVPAPLFLVGLGAVRDHAVHGHDSFFLGEYRVRGWWYYFPVLIAFKSPASMLLGFVIGTVSLLSVRRSTGGERREPLVLALALLAVVLPSPINIGIRHILPVYAFIAATAAAAIAALWDRGAAWRAVAIAICLCFALEVGTAYPDFLAWYNVFAGSHPEEIAVDSNLDWGQDILRLRRALRGKGIESYYGLIATSTYLSFHTPGFQPTPALEQPGWYVVSETALRFDPAARAGQLNWLLVHRPYERIGRTLRLYRVE